MNKLKEKFKFTSEFLIRMYGEDALIKFLRKGVYPYEYMDSFKKLETEFPKHKDFYSALVNKNIKERDYEYAKKLYYDYGFGSLKAYHDFYLAMDTLLLADVWENFRETIKGTHGLDVAHYYTLPGYSWDALLMMSKQTLDLLSDQDMFFMVERCVRGGISQASHRYAVANNPYMRADFDPKMAISYIKYLDANNLYGKAMSMKLPCGEFQWVTDDLYEKLMNYSNNDDYSYFMEVDVEYPRELHQLHNMLPFLPEKVKVDGVDKLIPNLNDKKNYVAHVTLLQQAVQHGLVVTKIHSCLQFKQVAWMKNYIDYNTKLRAGAKNDFEKDLFKLMNNSVFGKTMENLRNWTLFKLLDSEEKMLKYAREPNFKEKCTYDPGVIKLKPTFKTASSGEYEISETVRDPPAYMEGRLFGVLMRPEMITMNKPIYVGAAILDLSKTVMYEFHYDYMMPKYGIDRATLLYMDTDSLVYHIVTDDFYDDIADYVETRFDTSAYRGKYGRMKTGLNKNVIGLMKDETPDREIIEFVALRPKLYAYRFARVLMRGSVTGRVKIEGETKTRSKGVKKCVEETKEIKNYFDVLTGELSHLDVVQYNFQTKNHGIYTQRMEKRALTSNDDKRTILSDKIHTAAFGFNPV